MDKESTLKFLVATLALSLSAPASAELPWQKKTPQVTYILTSNNLGFSPELDDQLLIQKAVQDVLQREISETRSIDKNRVIKIILTTDSTNVKFNGTGKQLESEGGRIASLIQNFEAKCNDLERTYANVARDVKSGGYSRIRIVHIGRFVNVPAPCDQEIAVTVPQAIPNSFPLAKTLKGVKRAEFLALAVHPNQHEPLLSYFETNRVMGNKKISIEVLRVDETKTRVGFHSLPATDSATGGSQ
jgi:hypothetical protein